MHARNNHEKIAVSPDTMIGPGGRQGMDGNLSPAAMALLNTLVGGGVLGAGIGGTAGLGAGMERQHPIRGLGRGVVRGAATGAGAGLGHLLSQAIAPGNTMAAGIGSLLGGGAGYGLGGLALGKPKRKLRDINDYDMPKESHYKESRFTDWLAKSLMKLRGLRPDVAGRRAMFSARPIFRDLKNMDKFTGQSFLRNKGQTAANDMVQSLKGHAKNFGKDVATGTAAGTGVIAGDRLYNYFMNGGNTNGNFAPGNLMQAGGMKQSHYKEAGLTDMLSKALMHLRGIHPGVAGRRAMFSERPLAKLVRGANPNGAKLHLLRSGRAAANTANKNLREAALVGGGAAGTGVALAGVNQLKDLLGSPANSPIDVTKQSTEINLEGLPEMSASNWSFLPGIGGFVSGAKKPFPGKSGLGTSMGEGFAGLGGGITGGVGGGVAGGLGGLLWALASKKSKGTGKLLKRLGAGGAGLGGLIGGSTGTAGAADEWRKSQPIDAKAFHDLITGRVKGLPDTK